MKSLWKEAMDPQTIHLKDYKPSAYQIDSIDLAVDIFDDRTLVNSKLKLEASEDGSAPLELNGENLKLLKVILDGKELSNADYQLSSDKLVVLSPGKKNFILETVVEIHPDKNTALEGFYKSGDQLCTQCEPEGFRKITYYIDRPDVMAKFKNRMSAEKSKYPYLLSNGNRTGAGDLPEGRHWVEWEDPFRKPCYLFAMVAGDFDVARDDFTTMSGRKVDIEIYVDKGNLFKTEHAVHSLKQAMKWDEMTFGLEYDLDIYMIVAVDSFNMGAMENKGLNIFNSTYTLASKETGTDADFQNIQGVIGHEYFHNWTGNRVTCRDWFQLTLKEGLTVYRDQEFSSDMLSRAVKRIEDVRSLKDRQFSEDAGPLSHPIRPSSYIEINNFYTATIYEKGAEVIRMIATLIGKENFRKGMDKYFEVNDGKAVTTEDFVTAMESASGVDLSQFKNWYSRPGTPTLKIDSKHSEGKFRLTIKQVYPPTTLKVPEGNVLHMPFVVGFLLADGSQQEKVLDLKKIEESFEFPFKEKPTLSLNRGFSAPVLIDYDYEFSDLLHLMGQDADAYCRYEATQKVYDQIVKDEYSHYKTKGNLKPDLPPEFISAFEILLKDDAIDQSFKSYLLDLPSQTGLAQEIASPDFDAIADVLANLRLKLGKTFQDNFLQEYDQLAMNQDFDLSPSSFGRRSLKNQILSYLVSSKTQEGLERLHSHFQNASNMTDESFALGLFIKSGAHLDHPAVKSFYEKWKGDSLVMIKWFASLAAHSHSKGIIEKLMMLEQDPLFKMDIPNYLRALYMQFAKNNLKSFHAKDGSGYAFIAERVKRIDKLNPQVASRLASSFSMINKVDEGRASKMRSILEDLLKENISRDTYEVVSSYLRV